jgi:serine phosphatase RsbU (regulator of sigma subunit)
MAGVSLKSLLRATSADPAPVAALLSAMEGPLAVEDSAGSLLFGAAGTEGACIPVIHGDARLGCVKGPNASAKAAGALLQHLAGKESERRALANEVLHLYREVHLIDQLSEELTALLDVGAAAKAALAQAHKLIAASSGGVLVRDAADAPLSYAASFGDASELPDPESDFVLAVLERGVAEIVNPGDIVGEFFTGDLAQFRSLAFAPLRAKQRSVGVLVLANGADNPYSAADLKLLNTIALQTAAAIENSLMCTEMVEAARYREQLTAIQRELETARAIQHSLVPRIFPPFPGRTDFDLHAQMTSARHVGGDFFDFFLIDDDHLGLVIGDVSGKGTPSALYMAVTHTHVRSVAHRFADPADCLFEVSRILLSDKASSMFATCFYGILHVPSGELRFASAGHNPPFLVGRNGAVTALQPKNGFPLGLYPGRYETGRIHLHRGDALFVYTDGVTEAFNAADEEFSEQRLQCVLTDAASCSCRDLISNVHARVLDFTAGAPQSDDITMMAVRRCG